tara:strand:- start:2631 stop:2924 length:294 start_codon:yes stop_codon:yes gene_type:complete
MGFSQPFYFALVLLFRRTILKLKETILSGFLRFAWIGIVKSLIYLIIIVQITGWLEQRGPSPKNLTLTNWQKHEKFQENGIAIGHVIFVSIRISTGN